LYITTTTRSGFVDTNKVRMTLNDLECPIHPKVRVPDGTFDVPMLWVVTMRD